jgi:hypothetical protein
MGQFCTPPSDRHCGIPAHFAVFALSSFRAHTGSPLAATAAPSMRPALSVSRQTVPRWPELRFCCSAPPRFPTGATVLALFPACGDAEPRVPPDAFAASCLVFVLRAYHRRQADTMRTQPNVPARRAILWTCQASHFVSRAAAKSLKPYHPTTSATKRSSLTTQILQKINLQNHIAARPRAGREVTRI